MKRISCFVIAVMIVASVCSLCSCSKNGDDKGNSVEFVTGDRNAPKTKIGSGDRSFFFEIIDSEGILTSYNVLSDEEMVGSALSNYGLAEFSITEDSMSVQVIGKELAENDYWDFYVDGIKYEGNPFELAVQDNTIYSFLYVNN